MRADGRSGEQTMIRPIRLAKQGAKYSMMKKIAIIAVVALTIINLPDLIRYLKIETM
jgi:hypothetical protein